MDRRAMPIAAISVLAAMAGLAANGAPAGGAPAAVAPSCAQGPVRSGERILGTPCDDLIVVPPGVAAVSGGAGDDTILAAPAADSASCPNECRLGVGSQTFDGGPGDDVVFGERGNDILDGGEGNDRLFGGIGDDLLRGGPGEDRLAGGFGADSIDGEAGDDRVRGDGTIDRIRDTGGGIDTLSYATGITPSAFGGEIAPGFPGPEGERGLRLEMEAGGQNANNGVAGLGGGVDEVEAASFEIVVGTAFSDYIVGTTTTQRIYGGGGADVLSAGSGGATLVGGADGDNVDGSLLTRDTAKASVGVMDPDDPSAPQLYFVGGSGAEELSASYSAAPSPRVTFELSGGGFNGEGAGCTVAAGTATCLLAAAPDSVLIAGMGGDDEIDASGFPSTTSVVAIGGEGGDELSGGEQSEEALVDGPGAAADTLSGLGRDDVLIHNGGPDRLLGGGGSDLFLSVSICDGQRLDGGPGRDNGSWARIPAQGVAANLDLGLAGETAAGTAPGCAGGGELDHLESIEDLEGSEGGDVFVGDAGPNQLLGHKGADLYAALGGDDSILANSGDDDLGIDCGEGADRALIDLNPPYNDPVPVACESVREAEANNFRNVTQLPPPPPPPAAPPASPAPPRDRTAPQTRIAHRPPTRIRVRSLPRRVAFSFAASEPGPGFRCRLDRRPVRPCASPAVYRVGAGRHVFRVAAVDAAGNPDRSPALARFAIERLGAKRRSG